MKKLLFLLPLLAIISCDKTDVHNPYDAQYNSNGCLECDNYTAGESFVLDGISFDVADREMLDTAIKNGEDLTKYCTSKIQDMSFLFGDYDVFNQDIGSWDVSNVTDMNYLFYRTVNFNQDIGNWDVSSVTDMRFMFYEAMNFNQNIGNWNVSNVTDMSSMFRNLAEFNQNIGDWDVSKVSDMSFMFFNVNVGTESLFNQDLTQWCVSKINSIPVGFSTNSNLTASNHPVWGTCP